LGKERLGQAWWHIYKIPILGRQKQEDHEFKSSLIQSEFQASLGYMVRTCLKRNEELNLREAKQHAHCLITNVFP
jgi:hypothetical protein